MKKFLALLSALLVCSLMLCGCIPSFLFRSRSVMTVPHNDSMGEPKTFEIEGFRILLTDLFVEQKSERGFDGYYTTNFCGVVVAEEPFSTEEGLAELSLEEYTQGAMFDNGHEDLELQHRDDLCYYVENTGNTCNYVFTYRGTDAFWSVQFLCMSANASQLEDLFFLWAGSVEVD